MFRKYSRRHFSQEHKKTGLNGWVYNFSVDYKTFDTSDIIDVYKYAMERHDMK